MSVDALFRPFTFKSLHLKNRTVMAPMTRSFSPGGVPTAEVAAYYARRARAEVGLILSEGTGVPRPASLNDPKVPHFYGEEALKGWKAVVDAVHAEGGVMAPQLWHVGAMPTHVKDWTMPAPYDSPSGLVAPGKTVGQAMTDAEAADAISA
jgi:2,4-dienoyl-CoA reductase-like NADH-dependent reductase (Old Yellow Enzyme family)